MKWKELASGLCLMLLLVLAHHVEPEATDVFVVVCLIYFCLACNRLEVHVA
jgi:hypothetical protein